MAAPPCDCGKPSVMQTVSKQTANQGRKFFCCAKGQNEEGRCDYFQWEGEEPPAGPRAPMEKELYGDRISNMGLLSTIRSILNSHFKISGLTGC